MRTRNIKFLTGLGLGPVVDTDTRALGCNNGTLFEAHDGMRLGGAYMTELLFEGCARTSARALPTHKMLLLRHSDLYV